MTDFNPLVSIIIPVYNGADYLQCAIDSALEQDYGNIEVIVVDDGSKDNSGEIAHSYGNKIRYFLKENGGVAAALNLAVQNAKGEYISWLSHDDYYLPNKISRQIKELKKINNKNNILFSNANVRRIHNNQEIGNEDLNIGNISPYQQLTKIESLKVLFNSVLHGCTLLIPKTAFETTGYFDVTLFTTQDYTLWFKFINAGYHFYYLPDVLIVTRHHDRQGTLQKWNIAIYEQYQLWEFANKLFQSDIESSDKEMQLLVRKKIANSQFLNSLYNITEADLLHYHCKEFYPIQDNTEEIMVILQKKINWNKYDELENLRNFLLRGSISYYNSQFYQQLLEIKNQLYEKSVELDNANNNILNLENSIRAFEQSTSWRITKPLRFLSKTIKNLINKG